MSIKYYNPGNVNLEEAERGIIAAGGEKKEIPKDGYVHVVVYSRSESRHLSYDLYPDGHVENVHTDKDNHAYNTYGGWF